jgi:hypothetical protein
MSDNNTNVFSGKTETGTAASFEDQKVDFNGSNGVLNCFAMPGFIEKLPVGQDQNVIGGTDHIVHIQESQKITIRQEQTTTAQKKITITSNEDQIYIKAATQITLEVGRSKIVMASDGTIKIIGVNIETEAAEMNKIVGKKRVDINPRGSTEVARTDPPSSGPSTLDMMFPDRLGPVA